MARQNSSGGYLCTAHTKQGHLCQQPRGYGVDGVPTGEKDSGKCKFHGGSSTGPKDKSHLKQNEHAVKHNLYTKKDNYFHNLSDEEKEWVFDMTHTLLDRQRNINGKEPDMFDKEALKNIAIDLHKISSANTYFSEEGLTQLKDGEYGAEEVPNILSEELRLHNQSVYNRMKKHGLLDDPDSQKADSLNELSEGAEIIFNDE